MTNISTIATSQQSLSMRLSIAAQNSKMGTLTKEVATGMKEDVYKSNPGFSSGALEMRSRMASNQSYMDSNKLLAGKLDLTADLLTKVQSDAREFHVLALSGSVPESNRDVFRQQAVHTLEIVVDALNTSYRGEYLFSGLSYNTTPLEIDPSGETVTYNGDTTGSSVARIDNDASLNYGIRADNPAFTKIFDALSEVLTSDMNAMDIGQFETFINSVTTTMNDGLTDLLSVQALNGSQQKILQDRVDSQMAVANIYNSSLVDIEAVNMEETALRLQEAKLQLETTYQITARMTQMSLMDYL